MRTHCERRHALVEMVIRADKVTANPFHRQGLRMEEALIFRDTVRHELSRLTAPVRHAVLLMAEGYTAYDAARIAGLSPRTLVRHLDEHWIN